MIADETAEHSFYLFDVRALLFAKFLSWDFTAQFATELGPLVAGSVPADGNNFALMDPTTF